MYIVQPYMRVPFVRTSELALIYKEIFFINTELTLLFMLCTAHEQPGHFALQIYNAYLGLTFTGY